jgi:hypothetical protein
LHVLLAVAGGALLLMLIGCVIYACRGNRSPSRLQQQHKTMLVHSGPMPPPPNCAPPSTPGQQHNSYKSTPSPYHHHHHQQQYMSTSAHTAYQQFDPQSFVPLAAAVYDTEAALTDMYECSPVPAVQQYNRRQTEWPLDGRLPPHPSMYSCNR